MDNQAQKELVTTVMCMLELVSLFCSWHQRMNSGTLSEKEIATFWFSFQLNFRKTTKPDCTIIRFKEE